MISLTCDGLICIPGSDSIEVCNPATRESRRFPPGEPLVWTKHRPGKRITFGFGKDEVTGAYKVVELRGNGVSDCNVLDLEIGQWRQVSLVPYRISATERSVLVNGSLLISGENRTQQE
uniref:F-box/kelch-repeat protein n=1 Tax=Noccaea caerulescens TaxID=107243 RepID=A0A1J3EVE8_NOCCA